ncbi:hypothetical protein [Brevibacillus reuszeri]|uniref:hypothetical protein n=1 Tax=Brevibacillus reuszeri TaxID=54915 RepID=UPI000CCC92AD|nr:hypothetical protein [Brevibacillus reuszeri]
MGCSIHLLVEKKEDNKWIAVQDPNPQTDEETRDYLWLSYWQNYDDYAALCGVRNYSNVVPIHEAKGFPDDASDVTKEEYEIWKDDCHHRSWVTLEELLNVDWNRKVTKVYYLPIHIAEKKRNGEEPAFVLHTRNADSDVMFEEEMTLSEFAPFLLRIIEFLRPIGKPDEVRIVFWFED